MLSLLSSVQSSLQTSVRFAAHYKLLVADAEAALPSQLQTELLPALQDQLPSDTFEVVAARTSDEAKTLYDQHHPSLTVIGDLTPAEADPENNQNKAAQQALLTHVRGYDSKAPVVFLTRRDQGEDKFRGWQDVDSNGAYLTKPATIAEIQGFFVRLLTGQ